MMQPYIYRPKGRLAAFADVIWVSQSDDFCYSNITLPMLHHELVISFSERFDVIQDEQKLNKGYTSWLSGLQTRPVKTIIGGSHFTAGILLKPAGLHALVQTEAIQFQDRCVSLEDVLGNEASRLAAQVYETSTPGGIAMLLEAFLARRIGNNNTIPPTIATGLHLLQQAPLENGTVNKIAHQLSVSAKTFIHAFKKHVGLTPAKWQHLLLLNKAMKLMTHQPDSKLTDTCYTLDFTDQAHFIHFFKRYTGITPSAYRRAVNENRVNRLVPNSLKTAV